MLRVLTFGFRTTCVIGIILQLIAVVRCDFLDRLGLGSWFGPLGTISVQAYFEANSSSIVYTIPIEPWWDEGTFPKAGMKGFVIPANPFDACSSVEEPPRDAGEIDDVDKMFFLLTDNDNNCDYEIKVQNANASGYKGLIALNNGSKFPEGRRRHKYYSLPVCSVGEEDGRLLQTNYTYPLYSVLIHDRRCTWLHNLIGSLLILGVCCSPLIVLLLILLFWKFSRSCIRRIKKSLAHRRLKQRVKLLQSTISTLPIRKWARELDMLSEENKLCRICDEAFQDEEEIRLLPCHHIFHLICIDQWILEHRTFCPRCSYVLVPYDHRFPPSDISDSSGEFPQIIVRNTEAHPLIYAENSVQVPSQGTSRTRDSSKFHLQPGSGSTEIFDASFESVLHVPQNWKLLRESKQKSEAPDTVMELPGPEVDVQPGKGCDPT